MLYARLRSSCRADVDAFEHAAPVHFLAFMHSKKGKLRDIPI